MKRFFAGVALIGGLMTGPASAGPSENFGDWSVTCSDGLDCTVMTYRSGSGEQMLRSLGFHRGVGAEKDVSLDLTVGEVGLGSAITFRADDGETVELPQGSGKPDEVGRLRIDDPAVVSRLLPMLRDASSVTVHAEAGGKPVEAVFSLKGLVASLRFLDAAQYRDSTTEALEARGDKPPLDPDKLPKDVAGVEDLPPAVRKAWEAEPQGCSDLGDFDWDSIGFSTPVEDGRVYGLMCGTPGAYNAFFRFYHAQADGAVTPVFLPDMGDQGPVVVEAAVNPDWDDRLKILTAFFKGRGLGDCGGYNRWKLDPMSADFTLLESRVKGECDGNLEQSVEQWPRLWPK